MNALIILKGSGVKNYNIQHIIFSTPVWYLGRNDLKQKWNQNWTNETRAVRRSDYSPATLLSKKENNLVPENWRQQKNKQLKW